MIDITPFLGPAAGLINGFIGARGASRRQKLAIDNQWQMFQAQIKHQNEVNDRAMSFQREMNQRNEDWNTESNVRQRIEDAGYNPYLYQNGAMSANVNQSTPLAQNVAPTSPVDLPDPFSEFAHSAIDSVKGIADILLQRQNARDIAADSATKEYLLDRQKHKDNQKYAGLDLPTAESQLTHVNLETARQNAIIQTVNANLATLRESIYKSPAFDENDQPITDESGRQLMLSEVSDRSLLKANLKQLYKLDSEISNIESLTDLNKVKKKLDSYNLDNIAPAQVQQIYETIAKIRAGIKNTDAATKLIGEQTGTERVKRTGEQISNGLKAKEYDNYDTDKVYRRIGMAADAASKIANVGLGFTKLNQLEKLARLSKKSHR
ncbi:hypothetical protein ACQRD6_05145 [Prevotella sp. SGI.027]